MSPALGRYEHRVWEYDPNVYARPPRYRRACSYKAFLPLPIESLDLTISGTVAAAVAEAEGPSKN